MVFTQCFLKRANFIKIKIEFLFSLVCGNFTNFIKPFLRYVPQRSVKITFSCNVIRNWDGNGWKRPKYINSVEKSPIFASGPSNQKPLLRLRCNVIHIVSTSSCNFVVILIHLSIRLLLVFTYFLLVSNTLKTCKLAKSP